MIKIENILKSDSKLLAKEIIEYFETIPDGNVINTGELLEKFCMPDINLTRFLKKNPGIRDHAIKSNNKLYFGNKKTISKYK